MTTGYPALDDWIQAEAIPFTMQASDSLNEAIDRMVAPLGGSIELLGFGEALHGGEAILMLRNRLFQRLAEAHGFSAIAVESSFPRSRLTNDYVAGQGPGSYDEVQEAGFSHRFGRLEANRELVEWMRSYNADPAHDVKLHFYGFDMPLLESGLASPRDVLYFVLDYLTPMDGASVGERRQRIDSSLGSDADWETLEALSEPTKSVGLSPNATALRIETEDMITALRVRRPELAAKGDPGRYADAVQYALMARELLNYHTGMARPPEYGTLLGIRDAMMTDNLAYIVDRERGRGKVLAFAHNSHLQRGQAVWPWYTFWPAGSQLNEIFGPRYAVIGTGVGVSDANGIGQPEAGSLEARLMAVPGTAAFIPTQGGQGLPASELASLPTRSGSAKNPGYMPLTSQSFTDFDWLAVVDETAYSRGGPPLP